MLPFLKRNQEASMTGPVDVIKRDSDHEEEYDSLHSAAEDLMNAVHAKDISGIAMALRAAVDLLDSEPHEEGEHTNG